MAPLLELRAVSRSFGPVPVVRELSLTLAQGEALGVVGPNGAGKTTMLNLVAGTLSATSGRILLDGLDVTRAGPASRCRAGVGRTFQVPQPFSGLTVFENTLVGATHGRGRREDATAYRRCVDALELTGLTAHANRPAGSLTLLELRRLELARALATSPRLLLLDEIAGGLAGHDVGQLVATVDSLRRAGITIVWIEHVVPALLRGVDRLLAMAGGRVLVDGEPSAVIASPEVRRLYLGVRAA